MECISMRETMVCGFDRTARTFYTVQDLYHLLVFYLTKTVTHISRESDSVARSQAGTWFVLRTL